MSIELNKGLTSYRFFAFLSVYLFHFGFLDFGYIGVHAFFVLSGFLLTPILLEMKNDLPVKKYFIHFYGRRALRIFPLYFFYLICISIIAYVALYIYEYDVNNRFAQTLEQLPYAATYTYNFFTIQADYKQTQTITHFWSLAVEEQFYLLWPLVLILTPKKKLMQVLLLVIITAPVVRLLVASASLKWPDIFNSYSMTAYTFTFSSFDAFAIGGLFAVYVKSIKWQYILILIFMTFLLGVVTEYYSLGNLKLTALGFRSFMGDSYKYIWGFSLFSLIFACLLVKIKNRECLPSLIEHPIFVYLGTISYGLYVYHFPIMYFFNAETPFLIKEIQLLVVFFLSLLVSVISYEFMEKRFLNKKDSFFCRQ